MARRITTGFETRAFSTADAVEGEGEGTVMPRVEKPTFSGPYGHWLAVCGGCGLSMEALGPRDAVKVECGSCRRMCDLWPFGPLA